MNLLSFYVLVEREITGVSYKNSNIPFLRNEFLKLFAKFFYDDVVNRMGSGIHPESVGVKVI